MRLPYLFILFGLCPLFLFSQTTRLDSNTLIKVKGRDTTYISAPAFVDGKEQVYMDREIIAEKLFNGGNLDEYIKNNRRYPEDARRKKIEGTVVVYCNIKSDGKLDTAIVMRGVCPSIDDEAIRIIKSMPDWKPGPSAFYKGKEIKDNTGYSVNINIPFKL